MREDGKGVEELYFRLAQNSLIKCLEVKNSGIDGAGMGLYAGRDIDEGRIITVYLGRRIDSSVESIYSISNSSCILDCDAWSEGDPYLGAHMEKIQTGEQNGE